MDHHTVAIVSISGSCLDVLGSLYLAYDLLGGRHGPLRLLTWAVTYSIVFGIGYGVGLGLVFGLAAGIATGVTISVELSRAARGLDHYSLFFALGSGVQRHTRSRIRRRIVPDLGTSICDGIRHSRHGRTGIRLFWGHASRY